MTDEQLLDRIVANPQIMVGNPTIRGTRLTVEYVLGRLAHGSTQDELLREYPGLLNEDIQACLLFASRSLSSSDFMPLATETP